MVSSFTSPSSPTHKRRNINVFLLIADDPDGACRGNKAEAIQPLLKDLAPFINDSMIFESLGGKVGVRVACAYRLLHSIFHFSLSISSLRIGLTTRIYSHLLLQAFFLLSEMSFLVVGIYRSTADILL